MIRGQKRGFRGFLGSSGRPAPSVVDQLLCLNYSRTSVVRSQAGGRPAQVTGRPAEPSGRPAQFTGRPPGSVGPVCLISFSLVSHRNWLKF